MRSARWENWLTLILGAWVFLIPWTIGYGISSALAWNFWVVGFAIALSAALALRDLKPWEEWTNMILGVWLVLTPWIFGYAGQAELVWHSVIVGFGIAILSALALPTAQRLQKAHQRP